MDLGLNGRVVLVTGGSRGIGRAIAEVLLREGASVAICGRDGDACAATADELGPTVAAFGANVTEDDEVEALLSAVGERFRRLDGVVNNAGRFGGGPITDVTDAAAFAGLDSKPVGALRVVRHALPLLRQSDQPRIVNVAGASAERVTVGASVTAMANASMLALTAYLARELVQDRICVNAVVPGFVRTGVWDDRLDAIARAEETSREEAATLVLTQNHIGHARWGQPAEVAGVVAFLLSAGASFVSGSALRIDGGQAATVDY